MVQDFLACSLVIIVIVVYQHRLGRKTRMAHMDKLEEKKSLELETGAFN